MAIAVAVEIVVPAAAVVATVVRAVAAGTGTNDSVYLTPLIPLSA